MSTTDKHWASRQPAKQDEVRDLFEKGLEWAIKRKKEVAIGLAAAAVLGAAVALMVVSRTARENEAWDKLAMAEAYSYYGRPQEAAAALEEVSAQSASPAAAGLAGLMEGELKQAKGDHAAALAAFAKAADASPEALKPFAAAEKILAIEAAGKAAECAAAAQGFLDAHADHLLAPGVQETLARCQASSGQGDAARATWQKITLQYPETPWAARANAKLQTSTK
ncbi:MAG: hypothetical protein M0D55_13685 [Elusimicrobiota bacterium]|nr:MAG: hypothetical protein M0D55_13685 [Elusimicrobiota bacterium]